MEDDYIAGQKKIQLKTKTSNGMTYTTTGKLTTASKTAKDILSGDISCKYSLSGATLTTKLLTSGEMSQEVVLENTGVNGLKLTLLGGLGGAAQTLTATGEYIHHHAAMLTSVKCLGAPSVSSSLTLGSNGVTAGIKGDFDIETKELKNTESVINYSNGKEHEATCKVTDYGSKFNFAYSHIRNEDFSVAANLQYEKEADRKTLAMGVKYEVDPETTLKSKIDSNGQFSLSYVQQIRRNTTLTLCSQFSVLSGDKNTHKLGLGLVIE